MATLKIVIRNRIKANGKTPILYRVTIANKKQLYYKSGYEVEPKLFDKENGLLKTRYPGSQPRNLTLIETLKRFDLFLGTNPNPSQHEVNSFFDKEDKVPFHKLMEQELKSESYADGTIKQRKTGISNFRDFSNTIAIQEITPAVLFQFIEFLRKKGISAPSIKNNLKYPKKLLTKYYQLGKIKTNPGVGISVKDETKREDKIKYLESSDVQKIKDLILNDEIEITYRRAALFFSIACETGQAFVDLKETTNKIIKSGIIPSELNGARSKSGTITSIPLTQQAIKLYNTLLNPKNGLNSPIGSYDKYNKALKVVQAYCNITQNLTTHMARHTCACTLLENDVPIEIVSAFLGHRDLRTTQVYAKIKNKKLKQAISDFDLRRN